MTTELNSRDQMVHQLHNNCAVTLAAQFDRNNKMHKSQPIQDQIDTAASKCEALLMKLEQETDFATRQELLKALWRLSQPAAKPDADSNPKAEREHDSVQSDIGSRSRNAQAMCC